jgi:two-component system cell cycle response regulator DivK
MRPRLALVEDSPEIRFFLAAVLGEDYEIAEFESGEEALADLSKAAPALILMDITLPGIDGVETLRRLRAAAGFARIPAIALTGHAAEGDEDRFRAAGFEGYFEKPIFDDAPLKELITRLIAVR